MRQERGKGEGQMSFGDGWQSWRRRARRTRLTAVVLGLFGLWVGSATCLSGCILPTRECIQGRHRCSDRGREVCIGGEGWTHWEDDDACPSDKPFCIESEEGGSPVVVCASEPR